MPSNRLLVISHNHPNGAALPSMEDLEATGNIARALGLVNIHLLDLSLIHI